VCGSFDAEVFSDGKGMLALKMMAKMGRGRRFIIVLECWSRRRWARRTSRMMCDSKAFEPVGSEFI
jgi:hypothetical protein